jgi:hypothetical protein
MIAIFINKAAFVACFILGLLLGAVLSVISIGNTVDTLYYENRELELQLECVSKELEEVKSTLSQTKGIIITKISPEIKLLPGNYTAQEEEQIKLALNKEIVNHYQDLIGTPLKSLNPTLLPGIINGRIMEVDKKQFKVWVKTMVISETLYIEVEIEEKRIPSL